MRTFSSRRLRCSKAVGVVAKLGCRHVHALRGRRNMRLWSRRVLHRVWHLCVLHAELTTM